ncbi:unnamed protein product [Lupinus luteus]|uniref:Uncharacterized protein n=1 Tax=Lupinus luteus TaxID=3873 RepID=A0AAV1WC70_LUPLU
MDIGKSHLSTHSYILFLVSHRLVEELPTLFGASLKNKEESVSDDSESDEEEDGLEQDHEWGEETYSKEEDNDVEKSGMLEEGELKVDCSGSVILESDLELNYFDVSKQSQILICKEGSHNGFEECGKKLLDPEDNMLGDKVGPSKAYIKPNIKARSSGRLKEKKAFVLGVGNVKFVGIFVGFSFGKTSKRNIKSSTTLSKMV